MAAPAAPDLLAVDTNMLIDYLRVRPEAVAFLQGRNRPLSLSLVSVAELYVGVRQGEERLRLNAFVEAFDLLPLDRQAAAQAGLWLQHFGLSHGRGPPMP